MGTFDRRTRLSFDTAPASRLVLIVVILFAVSSVTTQLLGFALLNGTVTEASFWTHLDIWAPVVNTFLLFLVARDRRRILDAIKRKIDKVDDVNKEAMRDLTKEIKSNNGD